MTPRNGIADIDARASRTFVSVVGLPMALTPLLVVALYLVFAIEGWAWALALLVLVVAADRALAHRRRVARPRR